jgi:hypothetical protein
MNGIIYIRDNHWFKQANVYKVGITKSLHNRATTYKTGEVKLGTFVQVIKVPLDKLHYVDMQLKERLKPNHIYFDGGTEFYTRDVFDKIIEILKDLKIKYVVLSDNEIDHELNHKHKKKKKIAHSLDVEVEVVENTRCCCFRLFNFVCF